MPHILTGLLLGLSLIVAIGAQNAFVLRQGIRQEHVFVVALICTMSDWLLICVGTAGMGALVARSPVVLLGLKVVGTAYLLWFAVSSLRSAWKPGALTAPATTSARSVVATTLALTYLNPHVYLDTVVMLGALAASTAGADKWWFALGAGLASALWFFGLAYAARLLARPLARPHVWRWIDVGVAVVMLVMAVRLATT